MKLNIEHRTSYTFNKPVGYTIQALRLTPQDGFGQRVNHWQVKVSGRALSHTDAYGNVAHTLVMDMPHQEVVITASGEVETDLDLPPNADHLALPVYLRHTALTQANAQIKAFADTFLVQGKTPDMTLYKTVDKAVLMALMQGLIERVPLVKADEPADESQHSAIESLNAGKASSQGLAHLFIASCRALKVPARFVHGYYLNPTTNQIETHCWADAWLIDQGWQSFDVAHNIPSNGIHVRLATGLDYRDTCPISSVMTYDASSTSFHVQVSSMAQSQQ